MENIDKDRYDLLECPSEEHQYCYWYEYACEIKDVREGYIKWRKAQSLAFEKIRSAIVNGDYDAFVEPMDTALDDKPDLLRLYAHPAMEFIYLFPEFPDKPYLQLPITKRIERIKAYEKFSEKGMYDYTEMMGLPDIEKIKKIANPAELYLLGIDWRKGNDQLLGEFKNWLKKNRGRRRALGLRYKRRFEVLLDSLNTKRLRDCYPNWREAYNNWPGAARNVNGERYYNWCRVMRRKKARAIAEMNRWKRK